jgi:VanZ family protein
MTSSKYLILTVCLMIFAFADEYHQKIIPGRTFNPKDLISNLTGIAVGLAFCVLVFRNISKRFRAEAQQ